MWRDTRAAVLKPNPLRSEATADIVRERAVNRTLTSANIALVELVIYENDTCVVYIIVRTRASRVG